MRCGGLILNYCPPNPHGKAGNEDRRRSMRCASRLLDAHKHTWSSLRDYISFSFTDLFAKLLWPGDSEMTIRSLSRCHVPPMSITPRLNLHTVSFTLNVKQGSCEYHFLNSFGVARQGNELRSTDCKADAFTTAPSLLLLSWMEIKLLTAQSNVAELASRNAQISINKK